MLQVHTNKAPAGAPIAAIQLPRLGSLLFAARPVKAEKAERGKENGAMAAHVRKVCALHVQGSNGSVGEDILSKC